MVKKKVSPVTKAAWFLANEDNTVALYRTLIGFLIMVVMGLLAYFGNGLFKGQQDVAQKVDVGIVKLDNQQVGLDMLSHRLDRVADTVNSLRDRITKLETQVEDRRR